MRGASPSISPAVNSRPQAWNGAARSLNYPTDSCLRRSSVNGYAGAIDLLAAFRPDAHGTETLAGVRVTGHRETPGLGDFIDTARSPWILQFGARRPERVDAVTGATVTSEAVKRGVLALLQTARSQPSSDVSGSSRSSLARLTSGTKTDPPAMVRWQCRTSGWKQVNERRHLRNRRHRAQSGLGATAGSVPAAGRQQQPRQRARSGAGQRFRDARFEPDDLAAAPPDTRGGAAAVFRARHRHLHHAQRAAAGSPCLRALPSHRALHSDHRLQLHDSRPHRGLRQPAAARQGGTGCAGHRLRFRHRADRAGRRARTARQRHAVRRHGTTVRACGRRLDRRGRTGRRVAGGADAPGAFILAGLCWALPTGLGPASRASLERPSLVVPEAGRARREQGETEPESSSA